MLTEYRNTQQVMGNNMLTWFVPGGKPGLADGSRYPINEYWKGDHLHEEGAHSPQQNDDDSITIDDENE